MYKKIIISSVYLMASMSIAQQYVVPPTQSTSGYVPVISDEQMEQCIETYNQANWLEDSINLTYINQYSDTEVNQYNQNISQLNQLTNWFNQNCAGKQSYSACKSAQELNRKAGNPTQSCN